MMDEKEGAGNFPQAQLNLFTKKHRGNKQSSIIVDADDKNCLAQLTVALKLNHGVRQRLSR